MSICKDKLITYITLVPPEIMSSSWKQHLFEIICKQLTGRCTKEHGYITQVREISRILSQQIDRTNGHVRFHVELYVSVIYPSIGLKVNVTVEMISAHGIFCFYRMLRMMLPFSKCNGFLIKQDFSMTYAIHPSTKKTIKKTDIIPIIINDVRFENDLYSCIVSLDNDIFFSN